MSAQHYSEDFFSLHNRMSVSSAEQVIPVVLNYIRPQSLIDIGCGNGTWLKIWIEHGVEKIKGVDGDYVKKEQLLISPEDFISYDLTKEYAPGTRYDLVTSLEVGEHIPMSGSKSFVNTLCNLGDVVLFSAAIPGQGGTYHVNEQYPVFWQNLFAEKGYVAIDCLRKKFWDNEKISWWYRQNILFFVRKEVLAKYPVLSDEYRTTEGRVLSIVHPELLAMRTNQVNHYQKNLKNPVRLIGYYAKRVFKRS